MTVYDNFLVFCRKDSRYEIKNKNKEMNSVLIESIIDPTEILKENGFKPKKVICIKPFIYRIIL